MADSEAKLESAKIDDERGRVIQKQLRAVERVRDVIARIFELRKENVREELDATIKTFYREVAFKPYVPEVTKTFEVQLKKSVGGEDIAVAKGQGENQLLSLSFVGALARLARDRYDQRSGQPGNQLFSYQGGIYPVVMDSPFGALDENYRKEVAHVIPSLAPQVVLFVSRAQGAGVVRSELEARIGEQYVISYHTPKGEAEEEFFEIAGRRWPYIERSQNSFEWATINGMKTGKPQ